jgi:hypothetical protein
MRVVEDATRAKDGGESGDLFRACNSVQGATATMALAATPATWNLQLTESKESCRVRIPPSPPTLRSPALILPHSKLQFDRTESSKSTLLAQILRFVENSGPSHEF